MIADDKPSRTFGQVVQKSDRQNKSNQKKANKKKTKLKFDEKQPQSKLSNKTGSAVITAAISGRETFRRYDQMDRLSDSDENSALQASEAGKDAGVTLVGKTSGRLKHGVMSRSEKVSSGRLEAKNERLKHNTRFEKSLKDNKAYQNSKGISKQYQRMKLKRSYNQKTYGTYTNRAKKGLQNVAKKLKEAMTVAAKRMGIYFGGIVAIMLLILSSVSSFAGLLSNGVNIIVSTSYVSDDLVITETENNYNHMEADLRYAIEHVESDHSGYDEYRYDIDSIGHDSQLLMAYLTAKFQDFTVSQVGSELTEIFDSQYAYNLTAINEIRHKTVTTTTTDPETGETTTSTSTVSYTWHVLKVTLDTQSFESVLLARMNEEETEIYTTLVETKGNFPSLPSPIREDWESAVSSMYGYRLDPFTRNVGFHTGIDIAKPTGTELVAVFDGQVIDTGYDSGYGNYLVIQSEAGQTVLYGHCNSVEVSEGSEVNMGERVGTVGNTGNSTGSHLHFELRDSDGNRLNPYFYLSSEIAEDPL